MPISCCPTAVSTQSHSSKRFSTNSERHPSSVSGILTILKVSSRLRLVQNPRNAFCVEPDFNQLKPVQYLQVWRVGPTQIEPEARCWLNHRKVSRLLQIPNEVKPTAVLV